MSGSKRSLVKKHCEHPLDIFKDQELARGYLCPICQQILFNPVSDPCGHEFCHDCILTHVRDHNNCPVSQAPLELKDIKLSLLYMNIIENLDVVCVNKSLKCKWQGKFRDLNKHFKTECGFAQIKCQYKKCKFWDQRSRIGAHVRKCPQRQVKCRYCQTIMSQQELGIHAKECKATEVECYLGCGTFLKRKYMKPHHMNDCANFKINCEYRQFGCQFLAKRKEMIMHLENEEAYKFHIKLIRQKLEHIQDKSLIKRNKKNNYVKILKSVNFILYILLSIDIYRYIFIYSYIFVCR